MNSLLFILSCTNSGGPLLARSLASASNARCVGERNAEFWRESRLFREGRLPGAEDILRDAILPRAQETWNSGIPIHIEQNTALGLLAEPLARALPDARFLVIARDGRDCVAAMRNAHIRRFGNFYREARIAPELEMCARENADRLPPEDDPYDFGRPRPLPGDPRFHTWPGMTHHQMLCWLWNAWNRHVLDVMESLPAGRRMLLDWSAPDLAERILDAARALGMEDADPAAAEEAVRLRDGEFPPYGSWRTYTWRDWSDADLDAFWEICRPSMRRLGYFTPAVPEERRWMPEYGRWWNEAEASHDFYERIYESRRARHEEFHAWARPLLDAGEIASVLEIGCGHGIGHPDFFADVAYTGMDISPSAISWCESHRGNPRHRWICADLIRSDAPGEHDLAFCQGTVECMYDMDAFLRRMAACARKYVFLSGTYGFSSHISEHEYMWNEAFRCYASRLSISRACAVLDSCGFDVPETRKVASGNPEHPFEFVIIGRRRA